MRALDLVEKLPRGHPEWIVYRRYAIADQLDLGVAVERLEAFGVQIMRRNNAKPRYKSMLDLTDYLVQ